MSTLNSRKHTLKRSSYENRSVSGPEGVTSGDFKNNVSTFIIPTKGLVRAWKIIDKVKDIKLYFGEREINSFNSTKGLYDFKHIRQYIRDLIPETPEENQLSGLEGLFFSWQLMAFEYYKSLSNEDFENSIFTIDIPEIKITCSSNIEILRVEELFYDRSNEQSTTILFEHSS